MRRRRASRLADTLYTRLKGRLDPRIKEAVARRLAQRVALAVLGNRLSGWEPLHHGAILLADHAESLPVDELHRIFEEICGVLLVGEVVPIQQVRDEIRSASRAFLGMCICRQARRVEDLHLPGTRTVRLVADEERCAPWLGRLLDVWEAQDHPVTSLAFRQILDRHASQRKQGSISVAGFLEDCWPYFEILLDHPRYTGAWRETMTANRRTWRVDPEVLVAWAELHWHTRGVVFTSMMMVDTPYTICTCPGPEADGGCLLFNWHHFSQNPYVITENRELAHGQRRDAGRPLPCARFPERADKPCYGCGCDHADPGAEVPDGLDDPRPAYGEGEG